MVANTMNLKFKDAQFMAAAEKHRVAKAWEKFLRGGLRQQDFSKGLYQFMHLHASYTACFSQQGFYATYFESGEGTLGFFAHFVEQREGATKHLRATDYDDVATYMLAVYREHEGGITAAAKAKQRADDLAEAGKLLAKHGIAVAGLA